MLIRYTLADLGLRPIPSGTPFWASPDISVETTDPGGNPVAGEPNYVHARVFNIGRADATPTRVDFFWADPSLGLGPANMHKIGTEWVDIGRLAAVDVRCSTPWTPTFLNGGHECLFVECSNPFFDPMTAPFQPVLDRHIGQRNVHVLEGPPGHRFGMHVMVNNIFPFPARTAIRAHVAQFTLDKRAMNLVLRAQVDDALAHAAGALETTQQLAKRFVSGSREQKDMRTLLRFLHARKDLTDRPTHLVSANGTEGRSIAATWDGQSRRIEQPRALGSFGALATGLDALQVEHRVPQTLLGEVVLGVFEQRKVLIEVQVPDTARRGDVFAWHVSQQSEGIVAGGYTIVARVAA